MRVFKQIFYFYYDGFRSMTVGRKLWIIILIKLIIFFLFLRPFFFRNFLKSRYSNQQQRYEHVKKELIRRQNQ